MAAHPRSAAIGPRVPYSSYAAARDNLTIFRNLPTETSPPPETSEQAVLAIEDPIATPAAAPAGQNENDMSQRQRSLARAARHDILRRLAPPLRHDMVVHLQSLGMMAEALTARLERGALASEDLQAHLSKLNRLSRQAVATCLEVSSWMQPAEDDTIGLRAGIAEIGRLLSTSLNFRGFDLRCEEGEGEFEVSRSAVRFLLAAAVLTLADTVEAPGEIAVRAEFASTQGVVAIEYTAQAEGGFQPVHQSEEEPLSWTEVQALAAESSAELVRKGHAIILRLPRAVVTTPLKMVPV